MSKKIVEAKTVQTGAIKQCNEALKEILTDANIEWNEKGLKIITLDPSNTILVHLKLEKENLGTKATRANIIQTLYDRGYIREKSIVVTQLGIGVVLALSKYSPKVLSPELTRDFEDKLILIQEKKKKKEEIITDAKKILLEILNHIKEKEKQIGEELLTGLKTAKEKESELGKCPKCGCTLRQMISKNKKKFVGCSGYPDCTNSYPLPQAGKIEHTDKVCEKCNTPIIKVISKGKRPWEMCIDPKCETKANWGKPKPTKTT